jgi:cbb3-type cytochrome oxidase maturation protein
MYYPYFITYISIGLAITMVVFFWALKRKQFSDQQRARFLALEEEPAGLINHVKRVSRLEFYILIGLAIAGLGASGALLFFALIIWN